MHYPVASDPTIANAGMTELGCPHTGRLTNGHTEPSFTVPGVPTNSGFGDGAANAAAEANWDANADLSTSQEWVEKRIKNIAFNSEIPVTWGKFDCKMDVWYGMGLEAP